MATRHFLLLSALSALLLFTLTADCLADPSAQLAAANQDSPETDYIQLFEDGLANRPGFRNPYAGLPLSGPVPGWDQPNAVPFLVDVLRNGRTWRTTQGDHLARCYAALCLGSTKDSRALRPLTEAMKTVDEQERREYVAMYAAAGLGFLGDPNAIDPLIETLQDSRLHVRGGALLALRYMRVFRALKPVIEMLKSEDWQMRDSVGQSLAKMTKVRVPGTTPRNMEQAGSYQFWSNWWKGGQKSAEERFRQIYLQWKNMKKETRRQKAAAYRKFYEMRYLGIPALPYMFEKVQQGDTEFIEQISILTDGKVKASATPAECLDWWKKNKAKWLIPFEKTPPADSGSANPDSRQTP